MRRRWWLEKKGGRGMVSFSSLLFFAGCADWGMIKIRTAMSGDVEYSI